MIAIGPSGTFQAPSTKSTTYWNNNGARQKQRQQLAKLIPNSGSVERPRINKALERFRKASNCYYDLYNNGLCNRVAEFRCVFGFSASRYKMRYRFGYAQELYDLVEITLDNIIFDACKEQGIAVE
jgi:hypothetical protein